MVYNTLAASALMSAMPFYASKNCTLADVIKKIEKYKLSQIVITDSNFAIVGIITKKQIAKFLLLKGLKRYDEQTHEIRAKELLDVSKTCVTAYPTTQISEIKDIMEMLKLEHIPIVKTPWNRILVGFISYGEVQNALGEVMCNILF